MNLLKLYPIIFLFSWNASAKIVERYNYPYNNPYLASLTYEVVRTSQKSPVRVVRIPGLASRGQVPLLEGRNFTKVNFYKQKAASPLAFLITGTGSSSTNSGVNAQAEILFDLGYHVIVLPSPLNWSFILSENLKGTPGYTPDEAKDLYLYMQKVLAQLMQDPSFQVTKFSLAGYSLGAAEAAFVSEIDLVEKKFNFEKVLLVNPPFDLQYAVNTLDSLLYVAAKWTPAQISYVESLVYTYGESMMSRDPADPKYFYGFELTPFVHVDYDKFLIGASFRSTLGDDVFVNQQIKDTGLLKTKATPGLRSDREQEARSISFAEFTQKLVIPNYVQSSGAQLTSTELYRSASLNSLREKLVQNPRVYIFHNADDFLSKSEDLTEFEKLLGDRMTIFPHGGHLGNIWYSDNIREFRVLFQGPK